MSIGCHASSGSGPWSLKCEEQGSSIVTGAHGPLLCSHPSPTSAGLYLLQSADRPTCREGHCCRSLLRETTSGYGDAEFAKINQEDDGKARNLMELETLVTPLRTYTCLIYFLTVGDVVATLVHFK